MTVQTVYDQTCRRLGEPGGFTSGLSSAAEFLRLFSETIVEFMERTGAWKVVYTQEVHAGTREYLLPDRQMSVDVALLDGKLIDRGSQEELDALRLDWRGEMDVPSAWYEDGLAANTIGLYPNPSVTGAAIGGPFPPFGHYDLFDPGDKNLTTVGSQAPISSTWALGTTIPYLPNSAVPYLAWGVLKRLLSGDSELRDAQRSLYASARFEEGVNLFRAFSRAVEGEE
jgi:hypothetical protein